MPEMLTREAEADLIRRWRDDKDEKACEALVAAFHRYTWKWAIKYSRYGIPRDDLQQEACIGLLRALDEFDLSRDVRFSTYCHFWVRMTLDAYVVMNKLPVALSKSAPNKAMFFRLKRTVERIREESPNITHQALLERCAGIFKCAPEGVERVLTAIMYGSVELDRPASEDGAALVTYMRDEAPDPEEALIAKDQHAKRMAKVRKAMGSLSPRARMVIQRRCGEDGVTLEELGEHFGVSKERIRQIQNTSLYKLRSMVGA